MGNEQSGGAGGGDPGVVQVVPGRSGENAVGGTDTLLRALPASKLFEMNAHYRDDSVSKVDKGAAVALCAKLQARMREEAATTAALQSHLYAAVADTDALAQKAQGELITRERQLLRYTAYTREVHTVGKLLAQTRAHAYRLAEALTSLNHQLPVEERLEVFMWNVVPTHVRQERLERERIESERRLQLVQERQIEQQRRLAEQKQQQITIQNQSPRRQGSTLSNLFSRFALTPRPALPPAQIKEPEKAPPKATAAGEDIEAAMAESMR